MAEHHIAVVVAAGGTVKMVLLAMPTEDMELGRAPGIEILAGALREELAARARVPVIEMARTVK